MDFSQEPKHSDRLRVLGAHPWNAEPDIAELVKHTYTPNELVYSRNHCASKDITVEDLSLHARTGPVPALDEATFSVRVDGRVQHERAFGLEDLKREFGRKEVVAALQVRVLPRWYDR